jgi:murein tripeptide amidase MpaA
MRISAPSDSGNVVVLDATRPDDVVLRIREDGAAPFRHWFHLRIVGARGVPLRLRFVDMATTSYPRGWEGYAACASHDGEDWIRVPTTFAAGELRIEVTPETDVLTVAAFAPYPLSRHRRLVQRAAMRARVSSLTATVDGHDLERIEVGTGSRPIWIIARQHPGEAMAEWFAEGLLDRLLDPDDALARWLLERATFRIVPNMNPDGTARGHLRTNALGIDLNRAWVGPDPERAPEVHAVLAEMDRTGVALGLDIHGDEELPWNFPSGAESTPGWDDRRQALQDRFCAAWGHANPDFQSVHGYPPGAPGAANLTICTNQLAERFRCVAITVEQPFKDVLDRPDPRRGWSPRRAKALGASSLHAIASILDEV